MDWEYKHGKHFEWYLQLEREGVKVKALDSRPEIEIELAGIWQAFLNLARPEGISFTEVKAYLELMEITDEKAAALVVGL